MCLHKENVHMVTSEFVFVVFFIYDQTYHELLSYVPE